MPAIESLATHKLTNGYRTDLLCIEGIARALRVFLQLETCPQVKLVLPPGGERDLLTCHITAEASTAGRTICITIN